jgi:hypothetical protein
MPAAKKPAQWHPSFGDIVTVIALVATVAMWLTQPNWEIGIPITIVTIGAVIFTALRHSAHPFVRWLTALAITLFLIVVAWRPIWQSFHKDYPEVAFQWPVTFAGKSRDLEREITPEDLGLNGSPLGWLPFVTIIRSFTNSERITSIAISAINIGKEEVQIEDAYLISGINGRKINLSLYVTGIDKVPTKVPPVKAFPIPPTAQIIFSSDEFNGSEGISEREFLSTWAILSLVVEYNGERHRIPFDQQSITKSLTTTFPHASPRP